MQIVAATQAQGPMHLHSVADNLLEALAVVACTAPTLFHHLLFHHLHAWAGNDAEGQLLDRWVAIASTRWGQSGGLLFAHFSIVCLLRPSVV